MPTPRPRHAASPRTRRAAHPGRAGAVSSPRHAHHLPVRRTTRAVALVMTSVLVFAAAAGAATFVNLRAGLRVTDVDALLAGRDDRPVIETDPDDPFAGSALNLLVMGTDYRGGENAGLAGAGNEFHSDTTLLVHIAGDRGHVEVVSIPRDSLVDIPACPTAAGGQTRPRRAAMFNSAFAIGGGPDRDLTAAAACTILTVEHNTGVRITDHVIVKMDGLIGLVDAVGGVPVYLPEPVRGDRYVNLDLPAGDVVLDGDQSLNFVRARGGSGMGLEMGSDLTRITRQQFFVDALLRELLSQNVVTNAPQLFRLTEAALASVSPGRRLASPTQTAGLAWSLRALDPETIVFTPLPVTQAPHDPNRVVWESRTADALWARIAAGEPPPEIVAAREAEREAELKADRDVAFEADDAGAGASLPDG